MRTATLLFILITCLTLSCKTSPQDTESPHVKHDSNLSIGTIPNVENEIIRITDNVIPYLKKRYGLSRTFDALYNLLERDSINSKFQFSPENDTIYLVYKWYVEGERIYEIWNRHNSISGTTNVKWKEKIPIPLKNIIEEWDTNKLKTNPYVRDWHGGEHLIYSSRIIITNYNYTIESVEHEDYEW